MFLTQLSWWLWFMYTVYSWWTLCMRDGVYLARYQGSPVIKLTAKTSSVLFITDIYILDISSIISNLTVKSEIFEECLRWLQVVRLLLDHGADPNLVSKGGGLTPFHLASRYGHEAVVEVLLDKGENGTQKSSYCIYSRIS